MRFSGGFGLLLSVPLWIGGNSVVAASASRHSQTTRMMKAHHHHHHHPRHPVRPSSPINTLGVGSSLTSSSSHDHVVEQPTQDPTLHDSLVSVEHDDDVDESDEERASLLTRGGAAAAAAAESGVGSLVLQRLKIGFYFGLWYALNIVYNSKFSCWCGQA